MNFGGVPSAGETLQRHSHTGDVGTVVFDVDADETGSLHLEGDHRAGEGRAVDEYHVSGSRKSRPVRSSPCCPEVVMTILSRPIWMSSRSRKPQYRVHQGRLAGDR